MDLLSSRCPSPLSPLMHEHAGNTVKLHLANAASPAGKQTEQGLIRLRREPSTVLSLMQAHKDWLGICVT